METEVQTQEIKVTEAVVSTEAAVSTDVPSEGGDKKRKPRNQRRDAGGRYNDRDRQGQSWRNGNNWRSRQVGGRKPPVSAEALTLESILAREDKPIVFDLSIGRDKMELNDWFKTYAPSKIRRSDGIGWIMVML